MATDQDIRWEQRFSNFRKALSKLSEAVLYIRAELEESEVDSDVEEEIASVQGEIIKEGLIQRFEYTYELAWNVMKDYALFQGNSEIAGSRDSIRYAYSSSLVSDGELWMEMIKSRVKTSHTYNKETANDIYRKIMSEYFDAFKSFEEVMEGKRTGNQQDIFSK